MVHQPVRIGDVMESVLRKLGLERRVREAKISQEWARIVGAKIAQHSKPVTVKGRVLFVNVDSSVWLSELRQFFKEKMLEQLHRELGEERIQDIRFRIGEIIDA
ncbi:MAG: DUF721 domain-containing protein [Candidatus Aureabacteria bacterium]|nr:DUF721 domain-containing protein [Candidatus Auribacterota bacterium]